jgi:hypothetical protein
MDALSQDANAPWLARKDWASGDLYYRVGALGDIILLVFGLVLMLAAFAFASGMPNLIRTNGYVALIPLLIVGPLGIALTLAAIRLLIGGVKTGGVHFHLAAVPVPLGGPMRGELTPSKPIPPGKPVRLKLECISFTSTYNNYRNEFSTNSSVVWEDEDTVISDGSGTIPVAFVTPADAPATKAQIKGWPQSRQQRIQTMQWIEWHLSANDPSGKKQDYHAEFELPVFKVVESSAQVAEAESISAARKGEIESYQPGPGFNVRITPVDGGTEFHFPPVRGAAQAPFQTVVFLVMATIVVGFSGRVFNRVAAGNLPPHDYVGLILYLGFAAITLMFFFWILRLWFAPEKVVIANGTVSDTHGIFATTRTMPIADVVAIHVIPGQYTRQNAIRIKGPGWHYLSVGDGIREKRDAEWLALQMSHAAGVKASPSVPDFGGAEQMEIMTSFVKDFRAGKVLPKMGGLTKSMSDLLPADPGSPPGADPGSLESDSLPGAESHLLSAKHEKDE